MSARATAAKPRTIEQLKGVKIADMTPAEEKLVTDHALKQLTKELAHPAIAQAIKAGIEAVPKTRAKLARKAAAAPNAIEQFIGTQSPGRQRALRRHYSAIVSADATIDSISSVPLFKLKRDVGIESAALLLGTSVEKIRERLTAAGLMGASSRRSPAKAPAWTVAPRATIAIARAELPAFPGSSPTISMPAPSIEPLSDDARLAVRIDSLAIGTPIKTPDSPREGIAGVAAILMRVGAGSATVQIERPRRVSFKDDDGTVREVELRRGARIEWGLSTMVVPLSAANQ